MPKGPKDWMSLIGESEADQKAAKIEAELKEAAELEIDSEPYISDSTYSTEQAQQLAKEDLDFLAGLAMPTVYEYAFPPVLLAAWGLLLNLVVKTRDFSKVALGIPRSHAKTTLIKLFVLYCILFTDRKFILVFASTATKAENIIADIVDFLNESNIVKLFGSWRPGIETDRQDLKKFGFRGRVIILAALGAGGSVRGLNLKNERPDVMIFEDIQDKEVSQSEVQTKALLDWMVATAMKAKSPKGCLTIFCGNMYPGPNCILKMLKNNPQWISFTTGAILADGTALWQELRPLEELLDEFETDLSMGQPEVFFSEVLNDTDVNLNSRVDLSTMGTWKWGEHEVPQGRCIIIDPSPGKAGRDPTSIIRVDIYDQTPGVVEIVEGLLSPGNTILTALLMCLRHNIRLIAVEGTAYQATLNYWFGRETERLGITGIQCVEVHNSQTSKNSRISTMLKGISAQETFIHPSCVSKFVHQVANWNPMKRDNADGILDCFTYIPKVLNEFLDLCLSVEVIGGNDWDNIEVVEDNHLF